MVVKSIIISSWYKKINHYSTGSIKIFCLHFCTMPFKCICLNISIILILWSITHAWTFPVQQVSDPTCKHLHRDDHTESCKISIENIQFPWGKNSKNDNKTLSELIYSVRRWWTYKNGRDTTAWWHPWTDIVSAKGTPIVSIGKGEVVTADTLKGFWKTVSIAHTSKDGIFYSSYHHLDTIEVKTWDKVKEWEYIGNMGNSWFSLGKRWNHLELQVTRAWYDIPRYYYKNCPIPYIKAVNTWACREDMIASTIDPLSLFSFTNTETINNSPYEEKIMSYIQGNTQEYEWLHLQNKIYTIPQQNHIQEKHILEQQKILQNNDNHSVQEDTYIERKETIKNIKNLIKSQQSIDTELSATTHNYLANISSTIHVHTHIQDTSLWRITLNKSDKYWQRYTWPLSEPISFRYDTEKVHLWTNTVTSLENGYKHVFFHKKNDKPCTIKVYQWETLLDVHVL